MKQLLAFSTDPNAIVGSVDLPPGVDAINQESGGDIGILLLTSNLIQILFLIAGTWVIINLVLAGYAYLSSGGKTDVHIKVRDKISMSVIGLIVMISSYMVAGLVGYIFFGDATYILNPDLTNL